MDKIKQRKILKSVRDGMSESERVEKSAAVSRLLTDWEIYKKADTVMTYVSFGSEVKTDAALEKILSDGKTAAVPLCGSGAEMTARVIRSRDELNPGAYGVPEPPESAPLITKDRIDLIIVPGLGFDKSGYRIGYGKGYYDRYLKDYRGETVGLCFGTCLVDNICRGPRDRKVGFIITESEIIKTGN